MHRRFVWRYDGLLGEAAQVGSWLACLAATPVVNSSIFTNALRTFVLSAGAGQATLRLTQLPAGTALDRGTGYGRIAFSCPAADLAPLQVRLQQAEQVFEASHVAMGLPKHTWPCTITVCLLTHCPACWFHLFCTGGGAGTRLPGAHTACLPRNARQGGGAGVRMAALAGILVLCSNGAASCLEVWASSAIQRVP